MQYYSAEHRTIGDYFKDNLKEIESYPVEIVRILNKLGIKQVGRIYIDGTKLKGCAIG